MLNDGFQYLEQRDATNAITHAGVVSKESAFATADNKGIFDVIAEDLRALYDDMSSLGLAQLKNDVQAMYDDMRNNPEFGSTAATAQAQKALEAAERAEKALADVEADKASVDDAVEALNSLPATLAQIQTLVSQAKASESNASQSASTAATSETNAKASEKASATSEANAKTSETNADTSAKNAAASETNAKTSETNAKASETAAATSEANAKQSETNAKSSETSSAASEVNAKASETASATSEANAKTSETNAAASEANAKQSATNASDSAELSKKWAVDTGSPDGASDADSPTGNTQSSRTWALYSKGEAEKAVNAATGVQDVIDKAVDVLRDELTHKANVILMSDDGISPIISRFQGENESIDIGKVYIGDSAPAGTLVWFNTKGA